MACVSKVSSTNLYITITVFWTSFFHCGQRLPFLVFRTENCCNFFHFLMGRVPDVFERLERIITHEGLKLVDLVFFESSLSFLKHVWRGSSKSMFFPDIHSKVSSLLVNDVGSLETRVIFFIENGIVVPIRQYFFWF